MNIQVESKPEQSQAVLTISVPADEFKPFVDKAAEKISKTKELKGFRPGKAPAAVVAQAVGHEHLLQEALEKAVPHFFVEAAVSKEIDAINRPNISVSKSSLDGPLEFTATVDILPVVELGDPKKVKVEKRDVEVKDEEVDAEIEKIAKSRSTAIDVARPAKEGDVVTVDFDIQLNGQTIEGGESKEHPVPLGEGRFIPEFEKGLLGISAGDKRVFDVKFPEEYAAEELQGKTAQAHVQAHRVQQQSAPEINDEFAKSLGKFESLKHLKDELTKNMKHEREHREQERYLGEIAEKFAELSTINNIPDVLIQRDIDSRLQELAQMLSMQGKTIEQYLMQQKKTIDEMREDMRETAEKNVRVGLTLRQFAQEHDVQVDEKEVEKEAVKQLEQYKSVPEAEKNLDPERLREHIAASLRNRKTLKKLAELAEK